MRILGVYLFIIYFREEYRASVSQTRNGSNLCALSFLAPNNKSPYKQDDITQEDAGSRSLGMARRPRTDKKKNWREKSLQSFFYL